jgi:hypothetical protein
MGAPAIFALIMAFFLSAVQLFSRDDWVSIIWVTVTKCESITLI